ncbi:MAG: YHYH protein [Gemmataceae bacterium]
MKNIFLLASAILMSFCLTRVTLAHEGDHPPDMRVWKDAEGLFEIQASFILEREGQVRLLKHDGTLVWVPMNKLSIADQNWVKNRLLQIEVLNRSPFKQEPPTVEPKSTGSVAESSSVLYPVAIVVGLALMAALVRSTVRKPARISTVGASTVMALLGMASMFAFANDSKPIPAIQKHFEPFKDKIKYRFDDNYFYVESNGMPDHPMMIGITAWQQQVPIPQAYTGRNAWRIPLHPKMAENPVSAKEALFRGAIALAANGVPIFNPIKNDGRTDTFWAGELDSYGGHCGRADDYHYHIGPVHLEKVVGKGNPIGYALDGYPLYGYTDSDGKEPKDLDEFNGRMEKGSYRYYSTRKYPYINGGMRGEVTVREDQVDPQPRAYSPRPSLPPLRGAKITGFERDDEKKTMSVKYDLRGKEHSVTYTDVGNGYRFMFTDGKGNEKTETYRNRPDGKRPPKKGDRPPRKKDD